jgi:cyclopropane-fatty-acyl-phospholipid synthase
MSLIELAEKRWLPDSLIRYGMRRMLRDRLVQEREVAGDNYDLALDQFADRQRKSLVTIETHRANEQHYEVPAAFFELVLGSRLKYSGGWWQDASTTLDESEEAMLGLTCERAGIGDGMRVLDLGCGWGSLTLWIAEKFPNCRVTALSNSKSQKAHIESVCRQRGFANVKVVTADIGRYESDEVFDRVVSVEMFEHVRNHEDLLARIAKWLRPGGHLFVHIFCHRDLAYTFETEGEHNWMGRHFFSGGIMPAKDLFLRYQNEMRVQEQWWIPGTHYARTCDAWLARLDASESEASRILATIPNSDPPRVMLQRWRMFFMACAELFRYEEGNQWGVGHYLFDVNELAGAAT